MIIKEITVEKFRAFKNISFSLGRRITAIVGRNGTQKTTVLGMLGQPFSIDKNNVLYGCKTIDGYNFKSQFGEKFKFSSSERAGEHIWTIHFYNNTVSQLGLGKDYYKTTSILRTDTGQLRMWNAESRKKGSGYIQLPVYYLSLARLFPIGEASKTTTLETRLTNDEIKLCQDWYAQTLNIPGAETDFNVSVEHQNAKLKYTGVSRNGYDVFTNAAGEGVFTKIALAALSFRRLQMQGQSSYKGGILLIDEIDAALFPRAQKNMIRFLRDIAGRFNIQVIFTTHSPEVLKQINEFQLDERKRLLDNGINLDSVAYDNSIVYLEPSQVIPGTIIASNIYSARDLGRCLHQMDLLPTQSESQLYAYCEDDVATSFIAYLLEIYNMNPGDYLSFQDMNLGWTNYVSLLRKGAFKVHDSLIFLDADVPTDTKFDKHKAVIENAGNVIFLPLVIEKELFEFLYNKHIYANFYERFIDVLGPLSFGYETCFNNWTLSSDRYDTSDFKKWFKYVDAVVGRSKLFSFWIDANALKVEVFIRKICESYNKLADRMKLDHLALPNTFANTTSTNE